MLLLLAHVLFLLTLQPAPALRSICIVFRLLAKNLVVCFDSQKAAPAGYEELFCSSLLLMVERLGRLALRGARRRHVMRTRMLHGAFVFAFSCAPMSSWNGAFPAFFTVLNSIRLEWMPTHIE